LSRLPPFDAPWLKYNRAGKHFRDLQSEVNAFWNRDPVGTTFEETEDYQTSGMHRIVATVNEFFPLPISSIIGDLVHNLRSALDLMACDLVRLNGQSTKGVYFPFCNSAADLQQAIKDKNFDRASPAAIAEVIKLAPYKGGNDALRAIHDLDIQDKHRAIIPAILAVRTPDMVIKMGEKENQVPGFESTVTNKRQVLVVFPGIFNQFMLGKKVPCELAPVFATGDPYEGHHVVKTLHDFTDLVRTIVDKFELLSVGKNRNTANNP
jgi:hypothetical protein